MRIYRIYILKKLWEKNSLLMLNYNKVSRVCTALYTHNTQAASLFYKVNSII